ncbi:hypothetical protein MBLNU457_4702t1 [Dothideomycetes sp. NU457]
MTGGTNRFDPIPSFANEASRTFFENASAQRVNTDIVIVEALRRQYPQLHLTVVPERTCQLLNFAADGNAAISPIDDEKDRLTWKYYRPTARRIDGYQDGFSDDVKFGKFLCDYKKREFIIFVVNGRDGGDYFPQIVNQYVLSSSVDATNQLLIDAGRWTSSLHKEVFVFDAGYWQKSAELYESVMSADWSNVILPQNQKDAIIADVDNFFSGRDTYKSLKVPWKRGVIYYGPPGNGKTISIKAMMHALYERKDPVPTLYVRSLARRYAPCYLVFEDLDTIITPKVRSYFFNEVDGLRSNDGIFMIGSTNHLDQLDPGISKRPSRFDRKYLFPDPDREQRRQYAAFWQRKLEDNKDIEFPDKLCDAIAGITDGFSFAYMQEAFVASLLAIAGQKGSSGEQAEHSDDCRRSKATAQQASDTDRLKPQTSQGPEFHIRCSARIARALQESLHTMLQQFSGWAKATYRQESDNSGAPLWLNWSMHLTRSQLAMVIRHQARPEVKVYVDLGDTKSTEYDCLINTPGFELDDISRLRWQARSKDAGWAKLCNLLQRYDKSLPARYSKDEDEYFIREVTMSALQAARINRVHGCERLYHVMEDGSMKYVDEKYFDRKWEGNLERSALWRVEGHLYESRKQLSDLMSELEEDSDTAERGDDESNVNEHDGDKDGDHKELDNLVLWREMKKQVKILRDEAGKEQI